MAFNALAYSILLLSIFLSSCSIIKPAERVTTTNYVLRATPTVPKATAQLPLTVLVETPYASPAYNSSHMLYLDKPYQLEYFAKNDWAEPPAQMIQPLLMQTLQNTQRFRAVVATPFTGKSDIHISSNLLMLQQEFLEKPSKIHLVLQVQLIRNSDQQILAARRFEIVENAPEDNPYGGVLAANLALNKLLQQFAQFCVSRVPE